MTSMRPTIISSDVSSPQPVVELTRMLAPGVGIEGDRFGGGIVSGDFTGDGRFDLLIGAPHAGAGKVYPFQGSTNTANPIQGLDVPLFSSVPTTGTFGVGNFGLLGTN